MNFLLILNLVALVAMLWKVSSRMTTLEKFNALNTHVGQLLDVVASQAKTLEAAAGTIAERNQTIADLQAAQADLPAIDQGITDLDTRVQAALPSAPAPDANAQPPQ